MADPIATIEAELDAECPYDAGDPQAVNTARKKASRRRANRLEALTNMMRTTQGRRWMYELLDFCHIYHTPFVQGDPHASSFRMGEQNIGNRILADIMAAAPDLYLEMIREAKIGSR